MKKTILIIFVFLTMLNSPLLAQKTVKEKTKKEKKEKVEKKKGDPFIYDNGKDADYTSKERAAISKPEMPKYDVQQGFHAGKKKTKQETAFLNREYYYPAKPQNAWQVGIFGGTSILFGDISPNFFFGNKPALPGHNFGLHVTKAWSYLFSTRLWYSTMTMFTTDAVASTLTIEQKASVDQRSSGLAGYNPGQQFFHNSRTQGHNLNLDFIFSVGNLAFHKERSFYNFKAYPFIGMAMYQTFYDHYDANGNTYDYVALDNLNNLGSKNRADVLKDLSSMRDGKYETKADEHSVLDEKTWLGYHPRFTFGIGAGFTFRLTKWMYLDIETRQTFMADDLLDGMQWQEPSGGTNTAHSKGVTVNYDSYNQTTLGLTFNIIGKKTTEPLTMLNPMHYSYAKVAEADPQAAIDDLLKDDDGDGVPNRLDVEENTVAGSPVDPKGRALDSDKDGIIDFNDNEPFSPPGYPVDDKGVAIGTEAQLKDKVETIVNNMGGGANCKAMSIELPSVHFDKDKYNIKPEYYAHLYEVAQRMLMCPNAKVVATGMADKDNDTKYNEQLSYNRVDAVIDYITKTYGVDRERFIVKYTGEATAKGVTSSEQYEDRKVSLKLAEVETGKSNPSAPHPGINAGKAK